MTAALLDPKSPAPTNLVDPSGPMLDLTNDVAEEAVSKLIRHAIALGASDLFFAANEQHVAVQVRRLGMMHDVAILPLELARRCGAHMKVSASMDTTERRRPADGHWIFEPGDGTAMDIRISAIPTLHGEDLALRLLMRNSKLYSIDNLGMSSEQLSEFSAMIDNPSGLILITGPTGSGKTATLYAALSHLAKNKAKINTIENPIEFAIEGIRQSQVNPLTNLTFAELLRGVLRQSPDVIMVGEVRDAETAATAVQAANSGVLVFATVHAPAAAGAAQSMLSHGINAQYLAGSLLGVMSQRLVRTLCNRCKMIFDVSDAPQTFEDVRHLLRRDEGNSLCASTGCDHCGNSGYDSRTGVFEIMSISPNLRHMIAEGRSPRDVHTQAVKEGMISLRQAALLKVATGVTSTEELFRVIPSEQLLLRDH